MSNRVITPVGLGSASSSPDRSGGTHLFNTSFACSWRPKSKVVYIFNPPPPVQVTSSDGQPNNACFLSALVFPRNANWGSLSSCLFTSATTCSAGFSRIFDSAIFYGFNFTNDHDKDDNKQYLAPIPKAAGTSLCKILSPHVVRNFKCATASFIKDHIDGELWDRLFKVAWVRNPYERVASLWKYTGLETLEGHHNLDFNTWLYDPQITTHCLEFDKEPFFKRNPLTAFTYVSDVDGNMLVDFIGRLEYMKEDLNKLNELLSTSFKSAHLNDRNLGKNYREIYDDETKGYVADICKWEIEKFGYEFWKHVYL